MTSSQLYSIEGKENAVIRQICKVDVTTTSVANTGFSAYLAFNRAYAVAPSLQGAPNAPRAGAIANASVTTTGITVYVRGLSDAPLADGTLQVTATVEGRLA
jgi:hypothetical protein